MINVWICDDHKMVGEGLKLLLHGNQGISISQIFYSAKEVIENLKMHSPQIILLDVNMPDLNGIEACKLIKREFPNIKIIGLSMISESNLVKLMLKNGADGYLHKNAGQDEIIDAIVDVIKGKKYISLEIAEVLIENDDHKISNSPFPKLSRREEQILGMIINEKTTHEIAETLFISFGTVETHRRNIMIKLGAKNTAGMVRVALEYGLVK